MATIKAAHLRIGQRLRRTVGVEPTYLTVLHIGQVGPFTMTVHVTGHDIVLHPDEVVTVADADTPRDERAERRARGRLDAHRVYGDEDHAAEAPGVRVEW